MTLLGRFKPFSPPRSRFAAWSDRAARLGSLAVALACFGLVPAAPAAPTPGEYDVKAAFLYKLGLFVEWPDTAFATPDAPFVIGVLGEDPFGSILNELAAGEQINGHPLVVRRFTSRQLDEAAASHVLFISDSESRRLRSILQRLHDRPILTVADTPDFLDLGGAIGFSTAGSVRLVINSAALRTAHLNASSKLLRLAQVVEKEPPTP